MVHASTAAPTECCVQVIAESRGLSLKPCGYQVRIICRGISGGLKILNCGKQQRLKSQILDIAKDRLFLDYYSNITQVWHNLSPDPIALVSNFLYFIKRAKNNLHEYDPTMLTEK